jgi:hypothetical protein
LASGRRCRARAPTRQPSASRPSRPSSTGVPRARPRSCVASR